ncbi:MAG: DUF2442 domain-containing protein [Zetaproteobacteria bacterium]|nr:DUF2442 domain-containing protein [Zetaproteobacteria bacterium]
MNTLAVECRAQAQSITCTDVEIIVNLIDGRKVSAPLICFPRLAKASQEALNHWELLGDGEGIY